MPFNVILQIIVSDLFSSVCNGEIIVLQVVEIFLGFFLSLS